VRDGDPASASDKGQTMSGRHELRQTFESVAATYNTARPRYPTELFDELERSAGLNVPADVLEIGCATGIATEPMARRGHRITCVELGSTLAAQARSNLDSYPEVSVVCRSFEDWEPPAWGAFDLVYAATAWHWLDPVMKYRRAHRHVRPGGALAFWSATHVVPVDGDPFFVELQEVYDDIGESLPGDWVFPTPGELPDQTAEITATGLFTPVVVRHFDWETTYDADSYIALLGTFSGHRTMQPWQRQRLQGEVRRRLAQRPTGTVRRHWRAVLHVATPSS
jgi:SAM-dependent methyltransferase